MGALRRFERETGRDFLKLGTELSGTDLGIMLHCAVCSQCRADGVQFDEELDTFLDCITPEEVSAWYNSDEATAIEEAGPEEEGSSQKKNSE